MLLQYTILAVSVLYIARLFYVWFRLRNAPGPFLASTSNLWRAYYQYRGKLKGKLLELHEKHGPIVRYGANSISINDPDVIQPIYAGSKRGFTIVRPLGQIRESVYINVEITA